MVVLGGGSGGRDGGGAGRGAGSGFVSAPKIQRQFTSGDDVGAEL